jgi:hypothetical protein
MIMATSPTITLDGSKPTVLIDANPIILRRRKPACGSQEKPVSSNPETPDCILQFIKKLHPSEINPLQLLQISWNVK